MIHDPIPLITSLNTVDEVHLLVGVSSIKTALSRIDACLKSGAKVKIIIPPIFTNNTTFLNNNNQIKRIHDIFSENIANNSIQIFIRDFKLSDLTTLGRSMTSFVVDRVFVNLESCDALVQKEIFKQCVKLRIPLNTYQQPDFSTFNLVSTYHDDKSGLQIAITTNRNGCLLSNRLKRELELKFLKPYRISEVVSNMGNIRSQLLIKDLNKLSETNYINSLGFGIDEDSWDSHKLNDFVSEFNKDEKFLKLQRSRWLSQVLAYYPLEALADITLDQLSANFGTEKNNTELNTTDTTKNKSTKDDSNQQLSKILDLSNLSNATKQKTGRGSISLVGSGPGSISMLTLGALHEIKTADLVLADKLVPEQVLKLIPEKTQLFIARKFPGNAERAQQELLELAIDGLKKNLKVVRLKQGDPYIFGRGGEEYLYFQAKGYNPLVLPGISSALSSTVVAGIPATQRDIADQVLICTGTGRRGSLPENFPEYLPTRTTIFLMALHRAELLVDELVNKRNWDFNAPTAIIERASCPDQRVTRTKLGDLADVVKEIGSRPPGLIVIGDSVNALINNNDNLEGREKVNEDQLYTINEGYNELYPALDTIIAKLSL
ncbi:uroporphyrinogen-III C-methyltransferase SCDLUD_003163 [Saccharomycodes ludwigii]|uniref:uroporphyrinogen-III C-methyltransferase n=1 Tax=Saccharomycodes ludwigii TaxID=36035 RepID=UPI001E877961|nr:hypothetical protein SCDLUD_003163 [Saccharomycodes ludwigii]KAH3900192.1 hypothetical protein SCDLUD_003163 [Saccharomycodes ludwigii]